MTSIANLLTNISSQGLILFQEPYSNLDNYTQENIAQATDVMNISKIINNNKSDHEEICKVKINELEEFLTGIINTADETSLHHHHHHLYHEEQDNCYQYCEEQQQSNQHHHDEEQLNQYHQEDQSSHHIYEDQSSKHHQEEQTTQHEDHSSIMEDKLFLARAKAKEYFKNSTHEIICSFKKILENYLNNGFISSNYIDQLVRQTKTAILYSFNKLNDKIEKEYSNQFNLEIFQEDNLKPQEINNVSTQTNLPNQEESNNLIKKSKKAKFKIPKKAIILLKNWISEHSYDPYPNHIEKSRLAKQAGITFKQVQNWFINTRGRTLKRTPSSDNFENLMEDKLKEYEKKKFQILQDKALSSFFSKYH